MSEAEVRSWVVRGTEHGEHDFWLLENELVGIGFREFPDLSAIQSREEMKGLALSILPEAKERAAYNYAAQAWAFVSRMRVGDLVVLPQTANAQLNIGRVSGGYTYVPEGEGPLRHIRKVEWLRTGIPRTVVGKDLLYTLGAFSTVFEAKRNDAAWRLLKLASAPEAQDPGARVSGVPKSDAPSSAADADDDELADVATESGVDVARYIKDQISARIRERFDGHRLAQLVGAILEAEGFITQVSPPGADGGIDILAGRGLFGMDSPRIVVQVKSEPSPVSDTVVSQLHGAVTRNSADQGLLVAMGGVTKPAEHQLVGQKFRIAVWDAERLIRAIFENYEQFPADIKADLPLRRSWMLADD